MAHEDKVFAVTEKKAEVLMHTTLDRCLTGAALTYDIRLVFYTVS